MWLFLAVVLGLYLLFRWHRDKQILSNLTEKYVFITGCDSGFGNLLARQLDARGLRVLAGCFTPQGAEKLQEQASGRLQTTLLDVCSTESVANATEWVKGQVGDKGLWGLVNNAGVSVPSAFNEWLTKDEFKKVMDVNFFGVVDVTKHMLPLLRKARGRVVNMASVLGRLSVGGGGYSTSKYAVEAFSDSIRRENCFFGIKVSIIEPGFFKTAITSEKILTDSFMRCWERLPDETKRLYGEPFLQRNLKVLSMMPKFCSSDLSLVTNCMEHAVTAVHPRTRYSAGWDAKLFYIPLSYMPTWVPDMLFYWICPKPEQCK
ncbi:retinol dehydrogenase 16-like [Sphaerodactylus townsendi]|uniref:retinol dehydrogenase 16-like n=1 Tax=Sphaerodactylus townsendi TaxID=933632 RepID=UPI002025D32F|nr:retinol dehydrogenase 16-like [Sphaerodactylus townsendi]XP_048346038.1 retinol dehydrogenase 16-like [Sphaerodactylus townsendi]XP_048346039.1 retinol dehydrogenase 16-like [Sphaerodactylus townsendi]XP_048346040.1 retinol dehydrogenase 16-like [Sphaerodactylus townsendi]XP_048346041.1 retinol dehydrogenase 16-like [Sphaerodactylus townsendi]